MSTEREDGPDDDVARTQEPAPAPIWRRLVDAVRGSAQELGEAIADSQALRILDQEIRDADAELSRNRDALGETLAHYKVAQERLQACAQRVAEYEGYAVKALKADDATLAREVALRVAECEAQRDEAQARVERLAQSVADQRKRIAQTETHIRRLKQQVDTVRATATVQRAQAAVAQRQAGSNARVRGALESLERIKHRQRERSARMESAEELDRERDEDALEAKLRSAGIIAEEDGADAVLARLKQRIGE